ELVERAKATFSAYRVPSQQYAFRCGDVVEYLAAPSLGQFDVVLNLGFFYHTLKHLQIIECMMRTNARVLIFDTSLSLSLEPMIEIRSEHVDDPRNAIDHLGLGRRKAPVGLISRSGLTALLEYVGYDCRELDWSNFVTDFAECQDYKERKR